MRTSARLHSHDAFRWQRLRSRQNELVFLGVDIVGDDVVVVIVPEPLAQRFNKCGLARTDRPSDSDAEWAVIGFLAEPDRFARELCHDRNNLVYCVSCAMDAKSTMMAAEPRSSIVASRAFAPAN